MGTSYATASGIFVGVVAGFSFFASKYFRSKDDEKGGEKEEREGHEEMTEKKMKKIEERGGNVEGQVEAGKEDAWRSCNARVRAVADGDGDAHGDGGPSVAWVRGAHTAHQVVPYPEGV